MSRLRLLVVGVFGSVVIAGAGAVMLSGGAVVAQASRSAAARHTARSASTGPAQVSSTPAQTMQGFGASGDWWTVDAHYFPAAAQRRIASLLFSRSGIELSHYRYNLGGGGVGVDKPAPSEFGAYDESELGFQTRGPQTMFVAPGIYDWAHDPGGTTFLRYAKRYHVPDIEANVNSAPAYFTTNGQSCGGQLTSSAVDAYVNYIVHVIRHAHDAWHVTISYVSPMNEPDYTRSECTQEGMQVPPSLRAEVVNKLAAALAARAPYAHVIADESSQVASQFLPEAPQWLPAASRSVAAIATHTYDFPSDTTLQSEAAVAETYHKPLWMTEICCTTGAENHPTYGASYDPTMRGALPVAYLIWQDLTYGQMSTWDWWVSLSAAFGCDPATSPTCATTPNTTGYNDGLLYYDPTFATDRDYRIYTTKRFWTFGNFTRFVRLGAVRHDVMGAPGNVYLLAFSTARGWTVVAINENTASTPLSVRLPNGSSLRSVAAYLTDAGHNLSRVAGPARGADGAFTSTLPAQSVTTFQFAG